MVKIIELYYDINWVNSNFDNLFFMESADFLNVIISYDVSDRVPI